MTKKGAGDKTRGNDQRAPEGPRRPRTRKSTEATPSAEQPQATSEQPGTAGGSAPGGRPGVGRGGKRPPAGQPPVAPVQPAQVAPVAPAAVPVSETAAPTEFAPAPTPAEPGALPSVAALQLAPRGRRGRERAGGLRSNALGMLIERRFADPRSPVRSYSELERRSGISREALSRYVTPRADRRRSPTIDTLAAIADAMHMSLEQVCRAAVASAHGAMLPPEAEQQARDEVVAPLMAMLTADQFSAVVELLRQMQPRTQPNG